MFLLDYIINGELQHIFNIIWPSLLVATPLFAGIMSAVWGIRGFFAYENRNEHWKTIMSIWVTCAFIFCLSGVMTMITKIDW